MKTISKILYGLISFSVFAAYKIETAWAGWHVRLSEYASKCSGTGTSVESVIREGRFELVHETVCQAGQFLFSCGAADSLVYTNMYYGRPDEAKLEELAYSCRNFSHCEASCKSGTALGGMPNTILKVPADGYSDLQYDVEICDTDTLTGLFRIAHHGMTDADFLASGDAILLAPLPDGAEPMMQKYTIWFEADASDWVSMNDESFCYQPATDGTNLESGVIQRDYDCPFIYS